MPFPIQLQIRDIFKVSILCAKTEEHSNGRDKRERMIGGQRVQNCYKTIDRIVSPDVHQDGLLLGFFLRVLAANMLCGRHTNCASELADPWKARIMEILAAAEGGKTTETAATATETAETEDLYRDVDPATFWPDEFDKTPLNVQGSGSKHVEIGEKTKKIEGMLANPTAITKREPKKGYVYVYEIEGNPGLVKLGYTTQSEKKRHSDQEFACNRKLIMLYPADSEIETMTRYPLMVEALCHTELDDCRCRVSCDACVREHTEWFQVPAERAIAVAKKWARWMEERAPLEVELDASEGRLHPEGLRSRQHRRQRRSSPNRLT